MTKPVKRKANGTAVINAWAVVPKESFGQIMEFRSPPTLPNFILAMFLTRNVARAMTIRFKNATVRPIRITVLKGKG